MTVRTETYLSAILGSVSLGVFMLVVMQPWGPSLGPSYSPERVLLAYAVTVLIIYIPATLCTRIYMRITRGVRGVGEGPGVARYAASSVRTLTSAAIVAAVYALGGLPTGINVDLPALIASFSAIYFDPVVSLISFTVGFYIRWIIGGVPWLPSPAMVPLIGLIDGGTWSLISFIYWIFLRPRIRGRAHRIPLTIITTVAVHSCAWLLIYSFTLHPGPAAMAYITLALMTWHLTAIIFITIGVLIGDPMIEEKEINRKRGGWRTQRHVYVRRRGDQDRSCYETACRLGRITIQHQQRRLITQRPYTRPSLPHYLRAKHAAL